MMFLYLVPTGMNDPEQPTWGSWAGRYGRNPDFSERPYYWANLEDDWQGSRHRENTLKRWAVHLQNDFKARLDWCVAGAKEANHPPVPRIEGPLRRTVVSGGHVALSAGYSTDPDGNGLEYEWIYYPEAGDYTGVFPRLEDPASPETSFVAPKVDSAQTMHFILAVSDTALPTRVDHDRAVTVCRGIAGESDRRPLAALAASRQLGEATGRYVRPVLTSQLRTDMLACHGGPFASRRSRHSRCGSCRTLATRSPKV
jgi:hypothetical protein